MANIIKKGKSYLKEIHIETVKSKIHKQLSVSLIKGRYQLFTDKVIYSFEDLYRNFKVTAQKTDWARFKPESILILGLGLGSVIQIIEKKNKSPMRFTAVDIDESAVYLTHKYTASKFKSPVEYIIADANAFVSQNKIKYDLILIDVFIDDQIPAPIDTITFLKKLKSALTPKGIIWMNRIAMEPNQILNNMQYMEHVFKTVFPTSDFVDVYPNWILVSHKNSLK